jgi:hypothetical protein
MIELPDDFDFCYLYRHPSFEGQLADCALEMPAFTTVLKGIPMWGTVAYAISRKGAMTMLQHMKPMFATTDDMIASLIKNKVINSYVIKDCYIKHIGALHNDDTSAHLKSNIWSSGYLPMR